MVARKGSACRVDGLSALAAGTCREAGVLRKRTAFSRDALSALTGNLALSLWRHGREASFRFWILVGHRNPLRERDSLLLRYDGKSLVAKLRVPAGIFPTGPRPLGMRRGSRAGAVGEQNESGLLCLSGSRSARQGNYGGRPCRQVSARSPAGSWTNSLQLRRGTSEHGRTPPGLRRSFRGRRRK
jgi:hypothetical protein